jgi:hypothetical protein
VAELLAEATGCSDLPDDLSIPDELARREARLVKLAEACSKIEARARERFEREQADHEARRVTPRLQQLAGSPGANRPRRQPRASCRRIRSI